MVGTALLFTHHHPDVERSPNQDNLYKQGRKWRACNVTSQESVPAKDVFHPRQPHAPTPTTPPNGSAARRSGFEPLTFGCGAQPKTK
jgi:hypothetical protein